MSSYGDGSSEFLATIVLGSLAVIVLAVALGIGTWLHSRSEARKDAACARLGGTRIETSNGDHCIRKGALIEAARAP